MKKFKTALIIAGLLVSIALLAFFLPLESLVSQLPYISDLYNNTSLTVTVPGGKAAIKIDGKEYGESPATITDLRENSYTISLDRVTDSEGFYTTQEFQVELTRSTEAVINLEMGPADSKAGYILYYTKTPSSNNGEGFVTFAASPNESNIYLDDEFLTKSSLDSRQLSAKDYQVRITSNGYDDLTFPIIVRNGYNLNIQTYLFPIPWEIKETELTDGE